jgi:GNAT superfamily N-acetyltransferase
MTSLFVRALRNRDAGNLPDVMDASDFARDVLLDRAEEVTLAAHVIEQQALTKKLGRGVPRQLPAVLLARLALDQSHQGKGLGGAVLAEALARIKHVTADLGARFIVVDAIDPQAAKFYEHYGFTAVPDQESMRLVYRIG